MKPYITYLLIIIIFIVSAVLFYYAGGNGKLYDEIIYNNFALVSSKIKNGELWRFLTAVFIHFDLKHLGLNLVALYAFASPYEKTDGHFKLIFIFFVSGIISNLVTFASGIEFSAGASGAIFGLAGIFSSELIQGIFSKKAANRKRAKSAWFVIIIPVIFLIPGFIASNVNNTAHVSGLLTGFSANFIFDNDDYKYKKVLSVCCSLILIFISITSFIIGYYR